MKKILLLLIISLTLSNCVLNQGKIEVSLKKKANSVATDISVASVKIINNQFIITGAGLDSVTSLKVDGNSLDQSFKIESQSATQIIANSISAFSFDVSKVFNLILSSASASATFPIDFSICNATLNGKAFNCTVAAHDKDVLSYDANTNKWIPRAMNGLNYRGVFDASGGIDPNSGSFDVGDYYVINKAGTIGAITYAIGDWISFNGNSWDKIANSTVLTSVFGRTGVVVATKGDYDLNKLTDVDLTTTPPANGNVLKYNGVKWIPSANTVSETDPSVSAFAKAALPTCNAGEVLKGNGTSLSCVTTNSTPSGSAGGDLTGTYPNPTLAAVGTAGTYKSVTVDAKGRVTAGTNPTTLAGFGITDSIVTGVTATAPVVATGTTAPVISMAAATTAVDGYLKATDWTIFNNKQAALSGGATINGIIYPSSGAATLQIPLAPVALTDAVNKQYVDGLISGSGQWTLNGSDTYRSSGKVGIGTNSPGASLDIKGTLRLSGATSGYVGFAPAATAGTTTYLLPTTQGSAGQILSTDGVATTPTLSWVTPTTSSSTLTGDVGGTIGATAIGTGKVTSTHILDGTILDADINAGANITATKLGTGLVDNTEFNYLDGVTSAIQAQLNGKEPLITAGSTAQYLRGDKTLGTFATDVRATTLTGLSSTAGSIAATDTVLAAMGKLLNTQTDYVSKTGNSTITGTMTINTIVGALTVPTPVGVNDAVNKQYVDGFGQWTKSGSDIYRSSGSVGIGTTSPLSNLLLDVNLGATPYLIFSGNDIGFGNSSASWGVRLGGLGTLDTYGNNLKLGAGGAGSQYITLSTTNSGTGAERMRIDAAGNVGIGTTTPSSLLTVANGSGSATQTISAAAANMATLQLVTTSGATATIWSGAGGGGAGTSSNHDFLINSNNIERIRVAALNGNIGIGSTSPSSKLQVNGAITTPPNTFSGAFTCGTSTLDFSTSNLQRLSPSGTIAAGTCNVGLTNLVTGGKYTLVITGNAATNAVTYNLTGYTFKYLPTNSATTAGKDSIFTIVYDGTTAYVSWSSGY